MGILQHRLGEQIGKTARFGLVCLVTVFLLARPQVIEGRSSTAVTPVSYTLADGTRLTGFLSLPPNYQDGKKYPAILLIHGYRGVSRSRPQGLAAGWLTLKPHQKYLLGDYVVFSPEYYAEHLGDDREFQSLAAAMKTITSLPQVDPGRIAAVGASHGGYLALMSMMFPNIEPKPKTAVSICGVVDVAEWVKYLQAAPDRLELLPGLRPFACSKIPRAFGWPPSKDPGTRENFARISVLSYVKNLRGPIMVIHGANDIQVPFTQALMLEKALQQEHKDFEFLEIPGEGHFIFRDNNAVWEKIAAFLKKSL